jgi:NAD(P) transhydrogenase subunit alpha
MSAGLVSDISIFVLAILVGFEVISKVPSTLHTPLMSASNAIHGVVVVGAMITASAAHDTTGYVLTFVAAVFAAMNVVGGYAVTDRMLQMFKKRPAPAARTPEGAPSSDSEQAGARSVAR